MSEVYARRIYTFRPRFGYHLHLGAAELRSAVIDLGHEVLGSRFSAKILSEEENKICIRCSAATGALVYELDMKLMTKLLNFCERNNLDFSVGELEVKMHDMENWQ
jgi:hypothetical protein